MPFGGCLVLLAEVKQDRVNQSSSRDYPTAENKWLFWNHHCRAKKELGIVKTMAASFCTFHHLARKGVVSTPISIHILIYDGPSLDYPSVSSPSAFHIGSLPRAPMIGPSCLPRQDQSTATRIRGPSEPLGTSRFAIVSPNKAQVEVIPFMMNQK